MNRRTLLSTGVVAATTLSGCLSLLPSSDADRSLPTVPTGSWSQYGADGANTSAPNVAAPPRGNLAWISDAFTRWQPVVSDGTVYMTNFDPSHDGSALALDAQDGTEQWRTTLNASGDNGIAVVDETVVVAYDTTLVGLDPQTGTRRWTTPTNGLGSDDLLVADESTGTILVGSADGIEAFEAGNGEQRWETDRVIRPVRAPAVAGGRVFAVGYVDDMTSLIALSLSDGSERWHRDLASTPKSAAPVATQAGVVVSDGRTLAVYDRETGDRRRELHSFSGESSGAQRTVAADDGTVFVTDESGAAAIDIGTGRERWRHDDRVSNPGICVGTETVVFPVDDPEFDLGTETISAFDRESGALQWHHVLGNHHTMQVPPMMVGGAVFYTNSGISGLAALGDVSARDS